MRIISKETLKKALKPFAIVSDPNGNVGFIQEVSVNDCQSGFKNQIKYTVNWLTGDNKKHAWFTHSELQFHCNLFIRVAECSCHQSGGNAAHVKNFLMK